MNSRDVKETSESQMASLSTIEGNIELWERQAYVLLRVGTHVVGSVLDFTSGAYGGRSMYTGGEPSALISFVCNNQVTDRWVLW